MTLNTFIGQTALVAQLKRILANDKLGHAYAFTGPKGIGKRSFALAFAREILCSGKTENCNCLSCRTFLEDTNPDFYEVVSAKASIGVDVIRDLQKDAANRPTYGKNKVYFIDGAETMTVQAQNCFLKTLEEPSEYVVILLSVTGFDALLPTIQSRTVQLRLNPYSESEMRQILITNYPKNDEAYDFIIQFSQGIPGNALLLLEDGVFQELRNELFELLVKPGDFQRLERLRQFLTENREEIRTTLHLFLSIYRDCLLIQQGMENRLINSDKKDMIIRIASFYTKRSLLDRLAALDKLEQSFRYNINYQLGIDCLLLEVQEV